MEGLCKPDIVANVGQLGMVIEVQIAGQQSDLEQAQHEKTHKYVGNLDVNRETTHIKGACTYRWSSPCSYALIGSLYTRCGKLRA